MKGGISTLLVGGLKQPKIRGAKEVESPGVLITKTATDIER